MKNWLFKMILGLSAALMVFSAAAATAADSIQSPVEVVEGTAAELQRRLQGRQEYYLRNSAELYSLIDEVLLPNFDVKYAGKMVLGKSHWMAATSEQRERFTDAFYDFLIKTYAKGILEFDQENMVVAPDAKYSKDKRKAMIKTELVIAADDNVNINYSVRQSEDVWKIYDVRIDGVSYIQNYRNQFDAEISAQGIDAVISRLETEAEKTVDAGPAVSSQAVN